MPFTTLLEAEDLLPHLDTPEWAVVDCRFSLADPGSGWREYLNAHIPGAVYAHLDDVLSGPIIPGVTGRHPLPAVSHLARTLSSWGIDEGVQVVAYDDAGGSMAAARLWWLLQWLGHKNAAVLNGDWHRWKEGNYPVRSGEEKRATRTFVARVRPELIMDGNEIKAAMHDGNFQIIDVRAGERYRGEIEPIDPVAGHIPGAISAPFSENLQEDRRFKPPASLRSHYLTLLGGVPAERAVFYCGSGVTAAQGVLALAHAGLGESKLYPGSWSEWITDPDRPIATG